MLLRPVRCVLKMGNKVRNQSLAKSKRRWGGLCPEASCARALQPVFLGPNRTSLQVLFYKFSSQCFPVAMLFTYDVHPTHFPIGFPMTFPMFFGFFLGVFRCFFGFSSEFSYVFAFSHRFSPLQIPPALASLEARAVREELIQVPLSTACSVVLFVGAPERSGRCRRFLVSFFFCFFCFFGICLFFLSFFFVFLVVFRVFLGVCDWRVCWESSSPKKKTQMARVFDFS